MPRAFTEQERQEIHQRLLTAGRELFIRYGIRRTNIEDLTRSAGISKGAFYSFYDSKEMLFMDILEAYEAEMRAQLFNLTLKPGRSSRANLAELLRNAFSAWQASSFLENFDQQDLAALVRKIPEERKQAHLQGDQLFVRQILERWEGSANAHARDPRIVEGLMKALFFVNLHKNDLESDSYRQALDVLIDLVAGYISGELEASGDPRKTA
jgi:AcrR family transcriptional regulator